MNESFVSTDSVLETGAVIENISEKFADIKRLHLNSDDDRFDMESKLKEK